MAVVDGFVVGTAEEPLLSRPVFDGMALIQAGIAKVLDADLDTHRLAEALELIDSIERLGRQVDAAQAEVLGSIDRTGVYAIDGHRNAKPMVANAAKLSGAEVAARQKMVRVLDALPLVAAAYVRGDVSSCMIRRLGKVTPGSRHS